MAKSVVSQLFLAFPTPNPSCQHIYQLPLSLTQEFKWTVIIKLTEWKQKCCCSFLLGFHTSAVTTKTRT